MFRRAALLRRESWEYEPNADHRALVLLLYRNCLKGLIEYKSVRKRSLIAFCRMAFRKRGKATEKLLIDECIEEARRAIYVLQKNHDFTRTKEYQFDSMAMPKDTKQDVKTYMEDVYDPEVSRQQFSQVQDVIPGQEHLHQQGMGPASGPIQAMRRAERNPEQSDSDEDLAEDPSNFKIRISDDDKVLRPPPPPMEINRARRK